MSHSYVKAIMIAALTFASDLSMAQVPASVNWVSAGRTIPVLSQGQCNSGWAFATIAGLASAYGVFGGGVNFPSAQQLIDCSFHQGNMGCNGGTPLNALKYIQANGISAYQRYPYVGSVGKCNITGGTIRISGWTEVPPGNVGALLAAVAKQPVIAMVDATNWQSYKRGVFSDCGTNLNHAVLIVGYSQTEQYWLVQNSWGPQWGDNGFIKLKPGNTCGIANRAVVPNIDP